MLRNERKSKKMKLNTHFTIKFSISFKLRICDKKCLKVSLNNFSI